MKIKQNKRLSGSTTVALYKHLNDGYLSRRMRILPSALRRAVAKKVREDITLVETFNRKKNKEVKSSFP